MFYKKFLLSTFLLASLSACQSGDIKSTLGINKAAPDEFAVISNPPLSVPPAFNLRTPSDDYEDEEVSNVKNSHIPITNEDKDFLDMFDESIAKSKVKKEIDQEYKHHMKHKQEKGAVRKVLHNLNGTGEEKVIDPVAERRRIRDNITNDIPVNEGDVKNRSKSTLERIFG